LRRYSCPATYLSAPAVPQNCPLLDARELGLKLLGDRRYLRQSVRRVGRPLEEVTQRLLLFVRIHAILMVLVVGMGEDISTL